MKLLALALLAMPTTAHAGNLEFDNAVVPVAPPGTIAHAAYVRITNESDTARQLVGVTAEGYAMTHIHQSAVEADVSTMTPVDVIEIRPGQTVAFEPGGLHVMLMRPHSPLSEGDAVRLEFMFSDGTTESVSAAVVRLSHGP